MVGERVAQISRADDNCLSARIQAQNCAYFLVKHFDVISIPLLTETAEKVEILPYLRCGDAHFTAQLA